MSSGIETNKIVGAILSALLVTVAIGHFGSALFESEHGATELGYPVAAGTATEVPEETPELVPSVLPLLADASADAGEQLFGACRGCHTNTEGGANAVGPNLWGVVGRDIASHEGYSYSDALQTLDGDWTYDALNNFVHRPRDYAPGTKMTYAGLPEVEDRANLIAYLRTLGSEDVPLPTQEEIDQAAGAEQAAEGAPTEEATPVEPEGTPATDEAEAPAGQSPAEEDATPGEGPAPEDAPSADQPPAEEPAADEPAADEPAADEAPAPDQDGDQDAGQEGGEQGG